MCGLTLVAVPHLARSYHHLFPAKGTVLACVGACRRLFCGACDAVVHDLLHVCPGCEVGASRGGGGGKR